MAHLYKRGRQYWISYYASGDLVQRSLRTTDKRIARAKKKRLEYDLELRLQSAAMTASNRALVSA